MQAQTGAIGLSGAHAVAQRHQGGVGWHLGRQGQARSKK
jgi:hypothetical protein